jgi:hypothetical protein
VTTETEFVALGPSAAAFRTDGTQISIGADIAGQDTGLISFCKDHPSIVSKSEGGSALVATSSDNHGIYGTGFTTGVLGESFEIVSNDGSARTAFGLVGICYADSTGQFKLPGMLGSNAGVIGASNGDSRFPSTTSFRGAAVIGLSITQLDVSKPGPRPIPETQVTFPADGTGTGVWGASGTGIGVHGESRGEKPGEGIGVLGESVNGVGVQAKSSGWAPLYLAPSGTGTKGPPNDTSIQQHKAGELYVDSEVPGEAALFFCVISGQPGQPAVWKRVLLGSVNQP